MEFANAKICFETFSLKPNKSKHCNFTPVSGVGPEASYEALARWLVPIWGGLTIVGRCAVFGRPQNAAEQSDGL